MKSRSKKASMNIVVMAIYEIAAFACGLILNRLILSAFGSTYNGVVSSATQFLNYISILRLGVAGSTRVALYKVLAENDTKGISGIVNATENYMRKIGMVLIGYIAVLAVIYPYISNTGLDNLSCALLIVITGVGTFAQYFFGITYTTLLSADQVIYISYAIQIGSTVANTIVAAALIKLGFNIFIVKLGSALVFLITPMLLRIIVRKRYSIDKSVPPNDVGLKDRWNVMGHSIANIVHNNTDIIVLTIFEDIKVVSVYTVYYLVINGLNKLMNVFTSGLEGAFGNMLAKKEYDTAKRNFDTFEYLMGVFVSVVFSCTFLLIVPFVSLYTDGVTDANYIVPAFAYSAVLAQLVFCIRQPYLTIVQAAGHYKQTRNGAFAEAILNVIISVALVIRFGLVGVTIGTLVANAFRTTQYALYIRNNIINRNISEFLKNVFWIGFNIIVIYLISSEVLHLINLGSWLGWVEAGCACVAIAAGITLVSSFIFRRTLIRQAFKAILKMIKR